MRRLAAAPPEGIALGCIGLELPAASGETQTANNNNNDNNNNDK